MCLPPLHVWFNVQQVLEANAPWLPWGRFKHEPSELGMEDGRRVVLGAAMVSRKGPTWTDRLTRRLRFADQALHRLAAQASRRWPAQLGYQPGGATIGPCGYLDHSKQPNTRSGSQSVLEAVTAERTMVLHLISPEKRIPLLAFGIAPYSEQLL